MLKRGTCIIFTIAVTASVICAVRSCLGTQDDFIQQEATRFQQRTVPSNSEAIHVSGIVHSQYSAELSWEFETNMNWVDYGEWVKKQLPSDCRATATTASTFEFCESLPGDVQYLRIEYVPGRSRLKVRVTFRSQAD